MKIKKTVISHKTINSVKQRTDYSFELSGRDIFFAGALLGAVLLACLSGDNTIFVSIVESLSATLR
jgi:hypothetical protein